MGRRQRSVRRNGTWLCTSMSFLRARTWHKRRWTHWRKPPDASSADHNGRVVKTENWGLRSLAYRIAKNRKAHYVLLEIDAPGETIAEIERQAQINEDIIRYMTVKVDTLEEGPTVMMRKSERDRERRGERGDRGDRPDRGDRGDRPRRDRDDNAGFAGAAASAGENA